MEEDRIPVLAVLKGWWPSDWFVACLMTFFIGVIMLFSAGGLYLGTNCMFLTPKTATATLDQIIFVPSHPCGFRSTENCDDSWYLKIVTPDGSDWLRISHPPEDWEVKGLKVKATYVVGRWNHEVAVKGFGTPA